MGLICLVVIVLVLGIDERGQQQGHHLQFASDVIPIVFVGWQSVVAILAVEWVTLGISGGQTLVGQGGTTVIFQVPVFWNL